MHYKIKIIIYLFIIPFAYSEMQVDKYLKNENIYLVYNIDSTSFHNKYYRQKYPNSILLSKQNMSWSISEIYNGRINNRLDGEFGLSFGGGIRFDWSIRISNDPSVLTGYRGPKRKSIGGIRADILSSSLTYSGEFIHFSINRGFFETSHFGENLLFNGNSYNSDNIMISFEKNNFSLDHIISFLDPLDQLQRTAVYHRYGFAGNRFKIGFSDVALLAYENISAVEYRYLVPYSFLYEIEANNFNRSNMFWRFDFSIYQDHHVAWAEFLIDDFALDGGSPPKLAYLIGLKTSAWNHPVIAKIVKINRWVYNYSYDKPELRFINSDKSLGHPIGPDAMQVSLATMSRKTINSVTLDISTKVMMLVKGEGTIFESTPVPSSTNYGYSEQAFITGDIKYYPGLELYADFQYKKLSTKFIFSYYTDEFEYGLILNYNIINLKKK